MGSTLATASPVTPADTGPTATTPAGRARRPWRTFRLGVAVGILAVFAVRALINYTTLADYLVAPLLVEQTRGNADAIVVAGAGVTGPCVANQNAVRRVLLAARLWRASRAPMLVITGGPPTGLPCPVAEVMASLARELGVPADRTHLETVSRNTRENADLTAPILHALGVHRILLVTDRLHMRRASGVFARHGFEVELAPVPVYEGHPDNVSMLRAGIREYAALGYYQMRGWLSAPAAAPRAASERTDGARLTLAAYESRIAQRSPASASGRAMTTSQQPSRDQIVILGASYAQGWNPSIAGLRVVNRGITGQQSFELRERFARDVASLSPRAVVIWGFINDIFRTPRPKIDEGLKRTRDNIREMVTLARQQGIEPILATEVTIRPQLTFSETLASWVGWALGKQSYQDYVNGHVLAVNTWLREFARNERVLLLDLQPVVSDANNIRVRAFSKEDGSHITPAGYDALSAYAVPILAKHFGTVR